MTIATEHPISIVATFPIPDGEVAAHVEFGASLDDIPTWSLQTLNTGPARSSPAYDRHLEATIGSSYDWSDELRFDKRTGKLRSFVLKTPEAGALEPAIPAFTSRSENILRSSWNPTSRGWAMRIPIGHRAGMAL